MMEKTWNLNMAVRCVCSSPNSTSTKAPNGSMAWSLWSATTPVSGNREAITTTPTPGKRSGTGKHQEQEKFNKSQQSACRLLAFIELLLLLMLTSTAPLSRGQRGYDSLAVPRNRGGRAP